MFALLWPPFHLWSYLFELFLFISSSPRTFSILPHWIPFCTFNLYIIVFYYLLLPTNFEFDLFYDFYFFEVLLHCFFELLTFVVIVVVFVLYRLWLLYNSPLRLLDDAVFPFPASLRHLKEMSLFILAWLILFFRNE